MKKNRITFFISQILIWGAVYYSVVKIKEKYTLLFSTNMVTGVYIRAFLFVVAIAVALSIAFRISEVYNSGEGKHSKSRKELIKQLKSSFILLFVAMLVLVFFFFHIHYLLGSWLFYPIFFVIVLLLALFFASLGKIVAFFH